MNNQYEVGYTSEDNDNRRLPGSLNPEPTFNPQSDFAQPAGLDVSDTGGVVGLVRVGGDVTPTPVKTASVTGPTGEVETTYNHENLSKKFKYPQVHQDIPTLGNPAVTCEDHT